MPPTRKETIESLKEYLRKYNRRQHIITWVGAGLAGLVVLTSGDLGREILFRAPSFVRSLLLPAILLAGGALAYARVLAEWDAGEMEDKIAYIEHKYANDNETVSNKELPEELKDNKESERGLRPFFLALCSISFAGVVFLIGVWWPLISFIGSKVKEALLVDSVVVIGMFIIVIGTPAGLCLVYVYMQTNMSEE
jgi:hypothetical protein